MHMPMRLSVVPHLLGLFGSIRGSGIVDESLPALIVVGVSEPARTPLFNWINTSHHFEEITCLRFLS